jgi:hypothetical protein
LKKINYTGKTVRNGLKTFICLIMSQPTITGQFWPSSLVGVEPRVGLWATSRGFSPANSFGVIRALHP